MDSNNSSNTVNPEPPDQPVILPASNAQGSDNDQSAHSMPATTDTSSASATTNVIQGQNDGSMRNRIGVWYQRDDCFTSLCNNLEK
jgi:hypothetical protein